MIKLDYQETWYEKEERESFEKERSVAPSPNGENDIDAECAREELDDHILLKDLISELAPNFPSPNGVKPDCTYCDDKGCGFCVTGDSLAAHFPSE